MLKKLALCLVLAVLVLRLLPAPIQAQNPSPAPQVTYAGGFESELYLADIASGSEINFSNREGDDYGFAWSPDGRRVAFTSERDGDPDLYVLTYDTGELLQLTTALGEDYNPFWSPDGTQIAFSSTQAVAEGTEDDPDLFLINADGSNERKLDFLTYSPSHIQWSADGTRLLVNAVGFPSYSTLALLDLGSGSSTFLLPTEIGGADEISVSAFGATPDLSQIYFVDDRSRQLFIMNGDGSDRRPLVTLEGFSGGAFSPDMTRLAYANGNTGELIVFNLTDFSAQPVATFTGIIAGGIAWSPDGTQLAYIDGTTGSADVFIVPSDGSAASRRVNTTTGDFSQVGWRPVAQTQALPQIALARTRVEGSDFVDEVSLIDPQTGESQLIGTGRLLAWSPDGGRLAYADAAGNVSIFRTASGASEIAATFTQVRGLAWSPDGNLLAVAVQDGIFGQIYILPDGARPVQAASIEATLAENSAPVWSPDGGQVLFQGFTNALFHDIYVVNGDTGGGGLANLTSSPDVHEELAAWSGDGSQIYFLRAADSQSAQGLYVMARDGSGLSPLAEWGFITGWALAPDRARSLYVRIDGAANLAYVLYNLGDSNTQTLLEGVNSAVGLFDFSADSERFVYLALPPQADEASLNIVSLTTGETRQVAFVGGAPLALAWQPLALSVAEVETATPTDRANLPPALVSLGGSYNWRADGRVFSMALDITNLTADSFEGRITWADFVTITRFSGLVVTDLSAEPQRWQAVRELGAEESGIWLTFSELAFVQGQGVTLNTQFYANIRADGSIVGVQYLDGTASKPLGDFSLTLQ